MKTSAIDELVHHGAPFVGLEVERDRLLADHRLHIRRGPVATTRITGVRLDLDDASARFGQKRGRERCGIEVAALDHGDAFERQAFQWCGIRQWRVQTFARGREHEFGVRTQCGGGFRNDARGVGHLHERPDLARGAHHGVDELLRTIVHETLLVHEVLGRGEERVGADVARGEQVHPFVGRARAHASADDVRDLIEALLAGEQVGDVR